MKKWDLVIFDLDGTLIDTIGDLGAAVNVSMQKHGFPTHSTDEYRMMVGNGVRKLVQRALPQEYTNDAHVLEDCLADFLDYYIHHIDIHSRPYEGIHELLLDLTGAGTMVAVASNKFQAGTAKLIDSFFPDVDFCAVLGGCDTRALKPDAAIIDECRKAYARATGSEGMADSERAAGSDGATGSEDSGSHTEPKVVMVGDSATDIRTAIAAGITSIGVTWGFRPEEELSSAGANLIAHSPDELRSVLL